MGVFDLVERVRSMSPKAANLLLDVAIPHIIPLASGLRVRVVELDARRCVLSMPLTRRTRNHLGSMYFGAQMTLADLTAGVLLFGKYKPGPYGGVITKVESQFLKKAKGALRCVCELPPEAEQALEQVRTNEDGKAEAWVPLQLFDPSGQVVTEVRFLVAVKRFGPAPGP